MAERVPIVASPRTVLGKQVKQLRRKGILPANVYGRGLDSVPVQLEAREFLRTLKQAGLRSMFELTIEGEARPRYVIVRGLNREGGTGDPLHIDFYQVDLNRPITANVPLRLVGESPAVRDLAGTLLQQLDQVSVRCLPLDIPDHLEVDVTALKTFDVVLTVGDLKPPPGVEIANDPSIAVATVTPPRIRLDQAMEEAEEAEEAGEAAAAEGEAPAEGEGGE